MDPSCSSVTTSSLLMENKDLFSIQWHLSWLYSTKKVGQLIKCCYLSNYKIPISVNSWSTYLYYEKAIMFIWDISFFQFKLHAWALAKRTQHYKHSTFFCYQNPSKGQTSRRYKDSLFFQVSANHNSPNVH